MATKNQRKNILLAVACFAAVVALVAWLGTVVLREEPEVIQGQMEATEYRVSSKVPGRILRFCVEEGDYVNVGDTLVILDAPDLRAKMEQAQGALGAASALEEKARNGSRQEQIQGAFQLWQQAKAGREIAERSYNRVQHLFDEGVMSEQKRDEAYANYKAMEAQEQAAKSQYDMAVNGARMEDKRAAQAQVARAAGAADEVESYVSETVQTAQRAGEVSTIYHKEGELVGTGSPIMTITVTDDVWATFNVREDQLNGLAVGTDILTYVPALNCNVPMKVSYMKVYGSYAVWKATKANAGYDLTTFEVKARPAEMVENLRAGMSVVVENSKGK